MALPILNDKPKYTVAIPSLNKTVKFRPYLVKEEKILLLAMESNDPKQILQSIFDTIVACIVDDFDSSKLTTFDLEFLFLKIRSKSVGERAPLLFSCANKECNHQNEHTFSIDDVDLKIESKPNAKIPLTDTVSLKMKWPTYQEMIHDDVLDDDNKTKVAFSMITKCIDAIQTEEENLKIKDHTKEEIEAFIDALTSEQYRMITDYIESIPQLTHHIEFDCEKCGFHNVTDLKGINDFF